VSGLLVAYICICGVFYLNGGFIAGKHKHLVFLVAVKLACFLGSYKEKENWVL
jgi:hypothetical protein